MIEDEAQDPLRGYRAKRKKMNAIVCESSLKHIDCHSAILTVLLAGRFQ